MSDTPRTDAALVRVYGTTGTVCAATKKCAYPVFVQAELARQLERELTQAKNDNDALIHDNLELSETIERLRIRITELEDRNGYHLRQFDAAIRRVATALGGVVCGGVDTEDNINPATGQPYGPGGHTGWVLATEARKLIDGKHT